MYDDEDVKGLKIIQPMDRIIAPDNNALYTPHDLVKGLSNLSSPLCICNLIPYQFIFLKKL